MKVEDKSFTFRLPETLFDAVQAIADSSDLNIAQLVRRVLRDFVESTKCQAN